jgi:quaternary ammonium compound-resistance protein SugE
MRRTLLLTEIAAIAILSARGRPPRTGRFLSGRPDLAEQGSTAMAWVYLIVAGILEIVWAYSMKQSDGFTRLMPSVVTIVTMIASFALLALAMRTLPLGTAYTVWTGIGAVGAFVVGIFMLGELVTPMRVTAAMLIVAGLVMMKLSTAA